MEEFGRGPEIRAQQWRQIMGEDWRQREDDVEQMAREREKENILKRKRGGKKEQRVVKDSEHENPLGSFSVKQDVISLETPKEIPTEMEVGSGSPAWWQAVHGLSQPPSKPTTIKCS